MQSCGWFGTGIGIGAFVFARKRAEHALEADMIIGLTVLTAAILVEGWCGGARPTTSIT